MPLFFILISSGCITPQAQLGLYDRDGDGVGAIEGDCGPTCTDCDDSDEDVHPGAEELCNGIDDDCDGRVDADAADAPVWYIDADADGFGNSRSRLLTAGRDLGVRWGL